MIKKENIYLFLYTVREYKRFSNYFSLKNDFKLLDSYNEEEYIAVQTKLILLRKYGAYNEAVNVKDIAFFVKTLHHDLEDKMNEIICDYDKVQTDNIRTLLSDGTELNLYQTIENVMYGLYLHADKDKIAHLNHINERLLLVVTREYVQKFEKIVLKLYDCLLDKNYQIEQTGGVERATMLFLGDVDKSRKKITNSPYWANLYGNDLGNDKISEILKDTNQEELLILRLSSIFVDEIKKDNYSKTLLKNLVSPFTYSDWKDFSEAHLNIKAISNLGMSSKVRFNDRHDIAYVHFYENVEGCFVIDQPHIISEGIYVLSLVNHGKENGWKIYSFGSKLDDYLLKDK